MPLFMANELIDDWSRNRKEGVVHKLELEKAFDTVDWDFLDVILYIKGFGQLWRSMIRGCISRANFSIIINGQPRVRLFW